MNRMRSLPLLLLGAAAFVAAAAPADANHVVSATARISGCTEDGISGRLNLVERPSREGVKEVLASLAIRGLPPGRHGVHLHAVADCDPCADAGGHFDPGPNSNPSPDGNHPFHTGDLINVNVGRDGFGSMQHVTSRVTLSPGPLSLFDADGSAVIIHVDPDNYCPEGPVAGCAGGARAACGIIRLND